MITIMNSKRKNILLPPLAKLTQPEAQCIANMFRLYDYKATGKIPAHLATNLAISIGLKGMVNSTMFGTEVTLPELILILDQFMPDKEPVLASSLTSFNQIAAVKDVMTGQHVVTPQIISDFMVSLGRPAASINEASLMLNSMLSYDDCSEIPIVTAETFGKELTSFAKKTNAFKDYRP